jgi:hypothetical protein
MKLWSMSRPALGNHMLKIARFAANQMFCESSGMVMASISTLKWKARAFPGDDLPRSLCAQANATIRERRLCIKQARAQLPWKCRSGCYEWMGRAGIAQ